MKIWKFYRKNTNENIRRCMKAGATTEDIHPLLAFTNDKEFRDEFVSQRDMSLYIEKVSKGMDNDDWKTFANSPDNRGKLLQYYSLDTKYVDEAGDICSTKDSEADKSRAVTILATSDEMLEMEGVCDNLEACQFAGFISDNMVWSCPWIFKHKLQKALYDLGYETAWKLNVQYGTPERGGKIQPEGYDPESDWIEFVPDEFEVFTMQMLDWFKK